MRDRQEDRGRKTHWFLPLKGISQLRFDTAPQIHYSKPRSIGRAVNSFIYADSSKLRGEIELSASYNLLQSLSQLAREYDRKYNELEQLAENAQPEDLLAQLKVLAERTTDRFRAAQQGLLATLAANDNGEQGQQLEAVMALSSCFDEMRILFQILHQHTLQA